MAKINVNIDKDHVITMLEAEISKYDWDGREVQVDGEGKVNLVVSISFILDKPMGVVYSNQSLVQFFPKSIIDNIQSIPGVAAILSDGWVGKISRFINKVFGKPSSKDEILQKLIENIVAHENRHVQQYKWLADNGFNVTEVISKENETYSYMQRPAEKDAMDYAEGKVHPLNEVFGYLA